MNDSGNEAIELGELIVEGRFVDASNATLFAHAHYGDEVLPVIYKPIAGERPLWDFPDGNLASREVAAYQLSEALGLSLIPLTIMRDGPYGPGSVQKWIEIDDEMDVVAFVQSSPDALRIMALFDAITNNTDRKFGHILITAAGEIYGCDHGVCFHSEDKLRTVLWNWSGEPFSASEFEILAKALVASTSLDQLITPTEIAAMQKRITNLINSGVFPEPASDWPAVPFPPY
jgi:hypothetical protein